MGFGFGGSPSAKIPPTPVPPPPPDYGEEERRLAQQRKLLEQMRRGRKAFRIDVLTLPGIAGTAMSGLRIPE